MTTLVAVEDDADRDLVHGAIAGDRGAWETLVERYTRLVWHVVNGFRQLDHERRADVHQTVWLRLAEQLERLRDPDRVGGWLATTARHECIRQIRLADRETPTEQFAADTAVESNVDTDILAAERNEALWAAFARLRPEHQQLLRLLLVDPPFTYDEIAEILDIPRGSIGPTRQRCLDALRHSPGVANLEGTT